MELIDRIRESQRLLRSAALANEAQVLNSLVLPLLASNGWDTYDPAQTRLEHKLGKGRVDLALFSPRSQAPKLLIEVKMIGKLDALTNRELSTKQILRYAFEEGTQFVVLTDGREWSFFLPAKPGTLDERRVRKVHLVGDDPREVEAVLHRYLNREDLQRDRAQQNAERDWQALRDADDLRSAIDRAWKALVAEPSSALISLIAQETKRRAHKLPDSRMIEGFIRSGFRLSSAPAPSSATPPTSLRQNLRTRDPTRGSKLTNPGTTWTYQGERRTAKTAREAFSDIVVQLYRDHGGTTFYSALRDKIRTKTKDHIAPSRRAADPHERAVTELPGGWYLNVWHSNETKKKYIAAACEVAGIEYGRDLEVEFALSSPGAPESQARRETDEERRQPVPDSARAITWLYFGKRRQEKNASDMYENVISQLYRDRGDVAFYQGLQKRIAGRTTKHIAESPGEAGSRKETIRTLPGGWYLNTNVNNSIKIKHIQSACDVAGIAYDHDLVIESQ